MNRTVITGGPGSGKSTLLSELAAAGFCCIPEASRALIQQKVAMSSNCVPWIDMACFASVCLEKMISDFNSVSGENDAFFDRGIPDIIAYVQFAGLEVQDRFFNAAEFHRYADRVFIAPPWEGIYMNDQERWQSFEEASGLYDAIRYVYQKLNYELVELPLKSVSKRVEFITKNIKQIEY